MNERRGFDGILCFGGEDWWYHNRGHYDMQMMRVLSDEIPVLYVNSIGMRTPKVGEGKVFFERVGRKLKSFTRGLTRVRHRFHVFSPVTAPALRGSERGKAFLAAQVKRAARRCGLRRPLVWMACPPGFEILDRIGHVALVYQRTDRYETFEHVDVEKLRAIDRGLKERADLSLFCSILLYTEEGERCRNALFVDHGVDYDMFRGAANGVAAPADVRPLPHPRVGFVGGIDAQTFDPELFVETARRLPDLSFVLVGGCSLPEGWCPLPNVHLLGKKPYGEVAGYMAACDVLIMPWNDSEWIRACNPVKLKEYLAVGRPIVTTPFEELRRYNGLVRIAAGPERFAAAIRDALAEDFDAEPGRVRVENETWEAKGRQVREALRQHGIEYEP